MNYIIYDVLKTSIVISIPIILIVLLKNKILSKYTYKLNYTLCILITLRMLFISNINIYLHIDFLKNENISVVESINYMAGKGNTIINYIQIMFGVWLIGVIYVLGRNIYKQNLFYKKIENITYKINDNNILAILEKEKVNLNIKKDIKLFKVDGLSSPTLIGIINNKIIIPNTNYDKEQLKWVFRHELMHFKRKDNLLKLLLIIASAIHWFNPLVKVLNSYFNEQCELSCDENIVKRYSVDETKNYALVLVNTLRYRNTLKATVFSSQFNTNEVNLIKRRVEGMLNLKKCKNGTIIASIVGGVLVASVISISAVKSQPSVYANESDKPSINQQDENNTDENKGIVPKNYKQPTEEEILNNYKNNSNQQPINLYPDKKHEDLTDEDKQIILDALFSGKYSEVNVGSDSTFRINLEHLENAVNSK